MHISYQNTSCRVMKNSTVLGTYQEECPDDESWLMTYADLFTLLFAFFVLIAASGSIDQGKFDEIRESYRWDVSCEGTVPAAIISFLDSTSFEDAIRNAVSLRGDADTLACITGSIAEAFYGPIDGRIFREIENRVPGDLLSVVKEFYKRFNMEMVRDVQG